MIKSIIKPTLICTAVIFTLMLLLLRGSHLMFIQVVAYFVIALAVSFVFIASIHDGTMKTAAEYHKVRTSSSVSGIDPDSIIVEVSNKGSNVKERE